MKHLMLFLIIPLFLCFSPLIAKANSDFDHAKTLYYDLQYEKALSLLEKAFQSNENSDNDKAEIEIFIGLSYIQLGDESRARSAFQQAIALNPKIALPVLTSPKICSIFDEEMVAYQKANPTGEEIIKKQSAIAEANFKPQSTTSNSSDSAPFLPNLDSASQAPSIKQRSHNWPAITTFGVAVLVAAASGYMEYSAYSSYESAKKATYADEQVKYSNDANSKSKTANVLFGIAGGLGIAGTVMLIAF